MSMFNPTGLPLMVQARSAAGLDSSEEQLSSKLCTGAHHPPMPAHNQLDGTTQVSGWRVCSAWAGARNWVAASGLHSRLIYHFKFRLYRPETNQILAQHDV